MINQENIERMFDVFDESASILYEKYKTPYLEGLVKTCENIKSNSVDEHDEDIKSELLSKIKGISDIDFTKEEIRKSFQYACLRGLKHGGLSNQMITPETIGIFLNYLISKLYNQKHLNVLDPVVGTGNLIVTIANHSNIEMDLIGVDFDNISYQLSSALFDMLDYGDKIYFQDILTFQSPLVDLIVGDYSSSNHKKYYEILNHISNYAVSGGFIVSIVDEEVANDKHLIANSKDLSSDLILFGLLHLPKGILKNQSKSILIFQKKGVEVILPKKFLLVELPEFSNKDEMTLVINQINDWFKNTVFYKLGENK